jgi:hypothetical protein
MLVSSARENLKAQYAIPSNATCEGTSHGTPEMLHTYSSLLKNESTLE